MLLYSTSPIRTDVSPDLSMLLTFLAHRMTPVNCPTEEETPFLFGENPGTCSKENPLPKLKLVSKVDQGFMFFVPMSRDLLEGWPRYVISLQVLSSP